MSILASALRVSARASTRSLSTTSRLSNASAPAISNTIRNVAERAQAEAGDDAFKAGVVYTLLGVSALGAGYLVLAPKEGKTVMANDLL